MSRNAFGIIAWLLFTARTFGICATRERFAHPHVSAMAVVLPAARDTTGMTGATMAGLILILRLSARSRRK